MLKRTLTAAALVAFLAAPAQAEERPANCLPYQVMGAFLADQYAETRRAVGLLGNGPSGVVMYASPSGSWTAVRVDNATGTACIIAAGTQWHEFPPPPVGDPV